MGNILNTGNHPRSETFFELLRLFEQQPDVHYTRSTLEQLLLTPTQLGGTNKIDLKEMLALAVELNVIVVDNEHRYRKSKWRTPKNWTTHTQEQFAVLFFLHLSATIKSWNLSTVSALDTLQSKPGSDLILSLCWLLLLRPQKFGFSTNHFDKTGIIHSWVAQHISHVSTGRWLSATDTMRGFSVWASKLNLLKNTHAPMRIFSDAMLEYINSLPEDKQRIRSLLSNELFLFSKKNPIIEALFMKLSNNQLSDEVSRIDDWHILSSVAWSLRQRQLGQHITLHPPMGDGDNIVYDNDVTAAVDHSFHSISWG